MSTAYHFGTAAGIQTNNPNSMQILYKAEFASTMTNMCSGPLAQKRQYAYVRENSLEINGASTFQSKDGGGVCGCHCCGDCLAARFA